MRTVRAVTVIGVTIAPVAALTGKLMNVTPGVKNVNDIDSPITMHADYNVKDQDIPTYVRSASVSVSTWIDRVDLMLKGAEESGRGSWTDRNLYFIIGVKPQDNAARWWVNLNRGLKEPKKRCSYLKKASIRRYGERLNRAVAEWRVNSGVGMAGESYADFGAGLRSAAGRDKVSERVLVAAFIRNLGRTIRSLLLQDPKPKRLEKTIKKATKYEYPYVNVVQGTTNMGPPRAVVPTTHMMPMISNTVEEPDEVAQQQQANEAERDPSTIPLYTNPNGLFKYLTGT
ncbi:LOW QUALITY PROTEIN: hypothetical protein PHMEG_00014613 [Phytophthora megakarya]|uniref:RxLR effector protein n=1 Tax=Phytophthora megakarya TaxID=4795 RepID=A0A225W5F4_9STRA|nr:LOW QUALITY PROTEIN: hypothetical protein PHMEG_00014613 [Phytophthora megakarya]